MNKPSLYRRANGVQRKEAIDVVRQYAETLRLNSKGKTSLLDVGTASGDVLMEIVAPVFGRGFSRITGVDISPKMIEYCSKVYADVEGVNFKELDISSDHLPLEFQAQFDRVTSFFCLHWIQDQRKALENIYKVLRVNGDCLLMFAGSNSIVDAYRLLSTDPRWKNHVSSLPQVFSPLLDHPALKDVYARLLNEAGFVDLQLDEKEKTFVYEGVAKFKDNMKAVNTFPLPPSEFEDYFDAMIECFEAMGLRKRIPGSDDFRFILKYRRVVVYARKGK